jgi:hypothetical protein
MKERHLSEGTFRFYVAGLKPKKCVKCQSNL